MYNLSFLINTLEKIPKATTEKANKEKSRNWN